MAQAAARAQEEERLRNHVVKLNELGAWTEPGLMGPKPGKPQGEPFMTTVHKGAMLQQADNSKEGYGKEISVKEYIKNVETLANREGKKNKEGYTPLVVSMQDAYKALGNSWSWRTYDYFSEPKYTSLHTVQFEESNERGAK